jgi:MFS family permease
MTDIIFACDLSESARIPVPNNRGCSVSDNPQLNPLSGPSVGTKVSILSSEWQAIRSLSAIYAARMLGIFLLLPVLALYVQSLDSAVSPLWIGFAMGAYGLTQAVFQIPAGWWSDRYGRKPVIAVGLVLYFAGSVLGFFAQSVVAVIVARMVQGSGAISGPVTALLSDLTRPEVRTRAMAVIGMSIGAMFVLSLLLAPLLEPLMGVPGIFLVMAVLALFSLWLLMRVVQNPPPMAKAERGHLREALIPTLFPYYTGILMLNMVLVATFTVVPGLLVAEHQIPIAHHWHWYLGVFAASILPTVLLVWMAERLNAFVAFVWGALALGGSLWGLALGHEQLWLLALCLTGFFTGFNFLEARLPARLSQQAPLTVRGTALSIFATSQFLGSFLGGASAGILLKWGGQAAVLQGMALMSLVWIIATLLVARRTGM